MAGRLVSSSVEPEFDRSQYELLTALEEYEADLGSHGHLMSEATSPDGDPGNPDRKYRYVAGVKGSPGLPLVDWAAKARDEASEAYYKEYPDTSRAGHLWVVRKVPNGGR